MDNVILTEKCFGYSVAWLVGWWNRIKLNETKKKHIKNKTKVMDELNEMNDSDGNQNGIQTETETNKQKNNQKKTDTHTHTHDNHSRDQKKKLQRN